MSLNTQQPFETLFVKFDPTAARILYPEALSPSVIECLQDLTVIAKIGNGRQRNRSLNTDHLAPPFTTAGLKYKILCGFPLSRMPSGILTH
jgi:hypothetical protein